jgi:hypothetical protein
MPFSSAILLPGRKDGKVDHQTILKHFQDLAEKAGPDDQVFVFLAGHGMVLGSEDKGAFAFAAGVGSERGGDIQTLLRKRLRLGGLVLSGLYAYFTIASAHKAFRNFDYFRKNWYAFPLTWLVFLGIASLTGTVWRKRELSVKQ